MELSSKFNPDINVFLTDNKGNKLTRFAFKGQKENAAIERLFRIYVFPNRFILPVGKLFVKDHVRHFVQGIEVDNIEKAENYYGPEISEFKMKMILIENNEHVGPFYSNSLLDKNGQFNQLVDQYCKTIYANKFASAIIIEKFGDTGRMYAKIKTSNKQLKIDLL